MLSQEFEHKARSARAAEKLLRLGVPSHLVQEAVDLSRREMECEISYLGEAAPRAVKGATITLPENLIRESVRKNIAATALISIYYQVKKNNPQMAFAELFAGTWVSFQKTLAPMSTSRLDIDPRQAWVLIRFAEDGTLQIKKCACCGSTFPRVVGTENKCIICYQISFSHCSVCGKPLERKNKLYYQKWKHGSLVGVCPRCRKKSTARRESGVPASQTSLSEIDEGYEGYL